MEDHSLGADDHRGAGGPLTVTAGHFRYAFAERLIEAGVEMGLPRTDDFNGARQEGVGHYAHTIRRGRRLSAAGAFLDPIRHRSNLTIVRGIEVERLLFEGRRAVGIRARAGNAIVEHRCTRDIVVAAGTLNSPKLLQLSGIGDGALLAGLDIPVIHHNPGVGRHMRDHVGMTLNYRLIGEAGNNRRLRGLGLVSSIARYLLFRDGILSTGPFEIGAFARSSPAVGRPDMQLYFAPFSMAPVMEGQGYVGAVDRLPGLTAAGYLLRPTSEGHVAIASPDPATPVMIHPHWLATEEDRAAGLAMMKYIRRFLRQPALAPYIGAELVPGPAAADDAALAADFLRNARTGNHATGTCRMGREHDAVVDERLRVRGIDGLRVADCSIMPTLVSGNTSGPAMAVGWRASEIILADAAGPP
jgi:choline dehydrogenase-like flavoprotein